MDWINLSGVGMTFITKRNIRLTNYIRFLPRLLRNPSLVHVTPFLMFWAGIGPSNNKIKHDTTL
jgi:hypothetical protein